MTLELQEEIGLEDTIINVLASLWTMYDKLSVLHPLDKQAFQGAIHKAQAIVLARPKMRGILMAQQGIVPEQPLVQQQLAQQPSAQQPMRPSMRPVTRPPAPPIDSLSPEIDSLSDQPINIPLKAGEKACAIPIYGTGGMKTLPGVQR